MWTSKPHRVEKNVENLRDLKRSRCIRTQRQQNAEAADGDKEDKFESDCEEDNNDLKLQLYEAFTNKMAPLGANT